MQYNYYRILGITPSTSIPEIKRAYRQKAKVLHPDRNSSPHAAQAFHVLQDAYQTLVDPDQRRKYDVRLRFRNYQQPTINNPPTDPRHRRSPYANNQKMRQQAEDARFTPSPLLLISLYTSAMMVGVVSFGLLVFLYADGRIPWYTFFASVPALVLMFEGGLGFIKDESIGLFRIYRKIRNVFVPNWD